VPNTPGRSEVTVKLVLAQHTCGPRGPPAPMTRTAFALEYAPAPAVFPSLFGQDPSKRGGDASSDPAVYSEIAII